MNLQEKLEQALQDQIKADQKVIKYLRKEVKHERSNERRTK